MPVTRASAKAAVKAVMTANKLVTTTPNTCEDDFLDALIDQVADMIEAANSGIYTTYSTNVTPPIVSTIISSAPGAPCTGMLAITATTTATCVIP